MLLETKATTLFHQNITKDNKNTKYVLILNMIGGHVSITPLNARQPLTKMMKTPTPDRKTA
jgi:hypothetical protein